MKEDIYRSHNLVIFNFAQRYFNDVQDLANSGYFTAFLSDYIEHTKKHQDEFYQFLVADGKKDTAAKELTRLFKMLYVFEIKDCEHPYLRDLAIMDSIVEDIYNYWRKFQRFSLIHADSGSDNQSARFIDSDTRFNNLVIGFYRAIQEKIRGSKNRVYRQLQAGTNAAVVLRDFKTKLPESYYEKLKKIPFIDAMMLRTPLILYPKSNKREGKFIELKENPLNTFRFNKDEWMIYPAKVGTLLAFIYFHRDFLPSIVALSGLFELAADFDCANRCPDLILLFGNQDDKDAVCYYDDRQNNLVIGSVSYNADKIDYFGYLKKTTLTLHNIRAIADGDLPIHGAMINISFKSGIKKGVVIVGDSGAGKSESIEALQNLASDRIEKMDIIYDDMGKMFIKDGEVYCSGTEIGAFIRLDDLEKGSPYKDMDRSIFFNPHLSNARLVLPVNSYKEVIKAHRVDMMLYANNYTADLGIKRFNSFEEAKEVFIAGKRIALGTTDEKGLTQTYFANPFGPMQRQNQCDKIFDKTFKQLFNNDIFVGEIYSHLGLSDNNVGLNKAAEELLRVLEGTQ